MIDDESGREVSSPRFEFTGLPARIALEDTISEQAATDAKDPRMGCDTEVVFMFRNLWLIRTKRTSPIDSEGIFPVPWVAVGDVPVVFGTSVDRDPMGVGGGPGRLFSA